MFLVYGEVVQSDFELVLPLTHECTPPSIEIRRALIDAREDEFLVHEESDGAGLATLRVWRRAGSSEPYYRIAYGTWSFRSTDSGVIEAHHIGDGDPFLFTDLIVRTVLPIHAMFFSAELALFLHASGFVWKEKGILIVGPSGVGKSTCAYAMAERGAKFVCDDLAWIDAPKGLVRPAAVRVRLWQESVPLAQSTRTVTGTGGDKRIFDLPDSLRPNNPLMLGAIINLEKDDDAPPSGVAEPLGGVNALSRLLAHAFELHQPTRRQRIARMGNASSLVRSIPIWRVAYSQSGLKEAAQVKAVERVLGALVT